MCLLHLQHPYVGGVPLHTSCLSHFSNFYMVGDIYRVQKEAAILHFSCGCNKVIIYV